MFIYLINYFSLSGPSRDSVGHVVRDDAEEDPNAAMDVDEELQRRSQKV